MDLENIVDKFYEGNNSSLERRNVFDLWEVQRNTINEIITRIKNENGDLRRIAILGAGNCNDIDLEFLSGICKDITLFDIDKNALERGISKYQIQEDCKLELIYDIEFTGLYKSNFYNEFKQKLENNTSIRGLSKVIRNAVHNLDNEELASRYESNYDFIISMPVYTQLCYPLCIDIFSNYANKYKEKDIKKLMDEFNYLSVKSSIKYNDLIFRMGTENCKYFILTDVMEFTEETETLRLVAENYIKKGNYRGIEDLIILNHKLSGSVEGLIDFKERNKFQALNYWIWPFIDKRSYLVYGLRVVKNSTTS